MVKFHQNWKYLIFQGGRSSLFGRLTINDRSWNYRKLPYLLANTYGLNFIKIGGIWISRGGGGQKPPIRGGLHLICGAHFRTRMNYSSQKLCVKIWFGLVEIGGMLTFRGVGATCDLQSPFSTLSELFQSKVICENLVLIGWAFHELLCPQTKKKKKKKIEFPGAEIPY